ncbi:MAG: hypothetical protein EXR85_01315 [Xanthomonadales bacterium]|nr:hypothetical protein [Xanthomonadales bacterium]
MLQVNSYTIEHTRHTLADFRLIKSIISNITNCSPGLNSGPAIIASVASVSGRISGVNIAHIVGQKILVLAPGCAHGGIRPTGPAI